MLEHYRQNIACPTRALISSAIRFAVKVFAVLSYCPVAARSTAVAFGRIRSSCGVVLLAVIPVNAMADNRPFR